MIHETSGSALFSGDSAFLYSVIKWTVNVTRMFIGLRCFHYYKFCLQSQNLGSLRVSGSQGPGSLNSGLNFRLCRYNYMLQNSKTEYNMLYSSNYNGIL